MLIKKGIYLPPPPPPFSFSSLSLALPCFLFLLPLRHLVSFLALPLLFLSFLPPSLSLLSFRIRNFRKEPLGELHFASTRTTPAQKQRFLAGGLKFLERQFVAVMDEEVRSFPGVAAIGGSCHDHFLPFVLGVSLSILSLIFLVFPPPSFPPLPTLSLCPSHLTFLSLMNEATNRPFLA